MMMMMMNWDSCSMLGINTVKYYVGVLGIKCLFFFFFFFVVVVFFFLINGPVNTIKVMSSRSVYLTTLFLGRPSALSA